MTVVVASDDFHVVREVDVDHARQQTAVAGVEEKMVLRDAEIHSAFLAGLETQDLLERLAGN